MLVFSSKHSLWPYSSVGKLISGSYGIVGCMIYFYKDLRYIQLNHDSKWTMTHQGDICLYLFISDGACVTVSTLCCVIVVDRVLGLMQRTHCQVPELSMAWPQRWYPSLHWQVCWFIQHDSKAMLLLHCVLRPKDTSGCSLKLPTPLQNQWPT